MIPIANHSDIEFLFTDEICIQECPSGWFGGHPNKLSKLLNIKAGRQDAFAIFATSEYILTGS